MIKRTLTLVFLLTLIIGASMQVSAQTKNDYTNVKVDELSDAQVWQFMDQVNASGLSDAQLEQVALARGMKPKEIQKLRQRVNALKRKAGDSTQEHERTRSLNVSIDSLENGKDSMGVGEKALSGLQSKHFGAALFKNARPQFVSNLNIATPKNYVLGTGDEVLIDIYGNSEASYSLTISPEGTINIPYVGVISVAGTSIEQATARIEKSLSTVYSGIPQGNTKVEISLGNIRSIQVVMTGELVQPGTYTLPSVATVFNAMYAAGGPNEKGSLRDIRVIRAGKEIAEVDVYDFLVTGTLDQNIRLQDQDVILVNPYTRRVELKGEVKRPMIFDMQGGETFEDLLEFAGGFTEDAYQARVKVTQKTPRERRIEDVLSSQFAQYQPQNGDQFTVSAILDRYENRVSIEGAVFRPGEYELTTGLTLSMLLKKAEGIKEDAFLPLGYITRQKDNLEWEQINFNVSEVLAGTETDILLKKEDVVHISSIFDLREAYTIRIEGEVRDPGQYDYAEGMKIGELIMQAGGFTESASPLRIEVSRRVKNSNALSEEAKTAEVYQVDLNQDLRALNEILELRPFDLVVVRSRAGYEVQKNVRVEGEVLYPGIYTIKAKNERISDVLERSGGLTAFAYLKGASLKREGKLSDNVVQNDETQSKSEQFVEQMQAEEEADRQSEIPQLNPDGTPGNDNMKSIQNNYVGINLERILKNPETYENIYLEEGDVLYIPKKLQTVKVSGEVLSPVTSVYRSGKGFKFYISQAGGFTQRALKRRSYVIYANGEAKSTANLLFFKFYPRIEPGAEIFVPRKLERERLSPQAWIGMGTGVASLAAIIVSLLK